MPGAVKDVLSWYETMDVLLLTSSMEGTSNVAIEALWSGVPVVSTNAGGMAEVVQHEDSGILLDSDDPDVIASAVIRVLNDPRWREVAGKRGHDFVADRFSIDRWVSEIMEL